MERGIIYKVTNKINGKSYIGQTKSSINHRWSQHKHNAATKKNKCMYFENAIKKYGHTNFNAEVLLYCDYKMMNHFEILFIKSYQSTDREFGYNITEGGSFATRDVTDEQRLHHSKVTKKNSLPINIIERNVNGKLVGYIVQRKKDKKRYTKNFGNTKNTLDENLDLAIKYLEQVELGEKEEDDNRYNRTIDLPKNISYNYNNKKNICGYAFKIERNGHRHCKSFTFQTLSMEEKLEIAIKYKDEYLKNLSKN
jgi:group I intron endonuclease